MSFVLDGDYDQKLIDKIVKQNYPVTHYIVYVPQNSIGSSSILLPKDLPTWGDFKNFVRHLKQSGIVPIAQIDSTCQGNFEAHVDQFKANLSMVEQLQKLQIQDLLVSSPNNVGFIKAKCPDMRIYVSHSQLIQSMNRARIFIELGSDSIFLHSDIIRNMNALKNFLLLPSKMECTKPIKFVLPLNLGCNWGCIQWYFHHNLQSHRTMKSPLNENQTEISDVENEFDYPILYCWQKRLEDPKRLLKACWISPLDIKYYEDLGYDNFLLFIKGMDTKKALNTIKAYTKRTLDFPLNELLQIPHPYGDYWSKELANKALIQLTPEIVSDFVEKLPRNGTHTERDLNNFYQDFVDIFPQGDTEAKRSLIALINQKLQELRKGAVQR